MQALAQWQHLVALHEATDALHQAICPALHRRIRMMIEIASFLLAFFFVADYLFAHTQRKRPCCGCHKLEPNYCVVLIDVRILFVLYGRLPLTMDAVSTTIFNGRQAIYQKHE